MHYPQNLDEETLKIRVSEDFFPEFRLQTLARVDFALVNKNDDLQLQYLLLAEAKKGQSDTHKSLTQLLLTIGVHKLHTIYSMPEFLAAFDAEKIAFVPFSPLIAFLQSGDFNWKSITPSDYSSEAFSKMHTLIKDIVKSKISEFDFDKDSEELRIFIKNSVLTGKHNPIKIGTQNLDAVYLKWQNQVLPLINLGENWHKIRSSNKNLLMESDFFLADLISKDNQGLDESLRIILNKKIEDKKEELFYKAKIDESDLFKGKFTQVEFEITDTNAYYRFWNLYERPPEQKFWNEIFKRRDKLAPRDIMERKGAFFTPKIWSDKAKEYLAKALGKNWQENYYIWDCAAGTGNLLTNLSHPERVFASTLDLSDVLIMKELAKAKGEKELNLLENHIFQFDFLNDSFERLPQTLQEIIKDKEKREKLVIFINPPYAEHLNKKEIQGSGKAKTKINQSSVNEKYKDYLGQANRELFAQFFMRIYTEIPSCIMASFSKLKYLNSSNFIKFREHFKAKFLKGFLVPADTFDNVKGAFPIGFLIWKLENKK